MTILFITKPITLTAGTLAKSGDVNTLFDAVQSNLTTIAGPAISRAFKAPIAEGATDNIMTQVASTRALKTAYFDSTGNLFGSNTALAPFDMGGLALTGVPTPVSATDAVPFGYLAGYSSSLAGIPNVTGKGTSLLTTDGVSPSWTTGTQNIKLGNVTTGTWNAGGITANGQIQANVGSGSVGLSAYTGGVGFSIGTDGANTGFTGIGFLSYYVNAGYAHVFQVNGNAQFRVIDTANAIKQLTATGGAAGTNARLSVTTGDIAFGSSTVVDSVGTVGNALVSSVVTYAYSAAASIQHIDASQSVNNRRHEMVFSGGSFYFRFLSDAYGSPTGWLQVVGGQAVGAVSANFFIPINNTKTISFASEFDNGVSGTAKTIGLNVTQSQRVTLTANTTLTLTSSPGVGHFHLKLIQDATGSRTVTWVGINATEFPNNVYPAISTVANGVTFLTFYSDGALLWCKGSQPMD